MKCPTSKTAKVTMTMMTAKCVGKCGSSLT